ncbi:MAG: two-component system cell cycle response regulator [Acidimicrobiales bacterium]|jgi:two-component system cell cycle response regulator
MASWIREPWRAWLCVAALLTVVYFAAPLSPASKLVLYNGTGLLSVVGIAYGVRRNRPANPAPWIWFGWGLGSFLIADICYYLLELVSPDGPPFPSIADFFYLSMYPFVIVGLNKMRRSMNVGRGDSSLVITTIVGVATTGVLWILFVDTIVEVSDHSTAAFAPQLAYPLMDVALVAVAARLVMGIQLRNPSLLLILGAVSALAIADAGYGIYNTNGTFQTGLFVDAFWLAFYALFAAASLHPASVMSVAAVRSTEGRLTERQVAIMVVAVASSSPSTSSPVTTAIGWSPSWSPASSFRSSSDGFLFSLVRSSAVEGNCTVKPPTMR